MDNRPAPLHVQIALHVGKRGGITIRPAPRRDVAQAFGVFREVGNGDVVHRRAGLMRWSLRKSPDWTRWKSQNFQLAPGIWGFPTGLRSRNFPALLQMPTVYIKTYGCQMNERDSEAVAAQLVAKGYTLAPSEHVADVVLLNTCSVRDLAEQKALNKMENLAADIRRSRPHVVLGFMGCMAQSRGQELIDRLPDVDLVVGTQKFHRTADYLDDIFAGRREKIVDVATEADSEARIREHVLDGNGHKAVTAFVSIMQ